jgi:hypothetical protein
VSEAGALEVSDGSLPADEPPGPGLRRELLVALGAAIVVAALGFPLGWLWSAVAPWTPVLMTTGGPVYAQPEQEQMIADEGWYVFITIGAGILVAVLAWVLLRRYRGVPMVLALALGAIGGGVLTWWFGHSIGLDHYRYIYQHAAAGTTFTRPVDLRVKQVGWWHGWLPYARGDVLLFAVGAAVAYVLLAGFSAYPSLRGTREQVSSDG